MHVVCTNELLMCVGFILGACDIRSQVIVCVCVCVHVGVHKHTRMRMYTENHILKN